jgi:TetR/AcrR family fatty acid metabolism transcriptional regulator
MPQNATRRQVNRLPPERRVSDIMLAAKEVFAEKGYSDALISEIAESAGVVEGSIYRFFTNKRELLVRVVEDWYDGLLSEASDHFAGVRGTWNRIRFIIHQHLTTIKREPALSRLVFQELRPDPEYRKSRLFQLNQAYTHRIVEVVNEAASAGEFRGDVSPHLVRDMIYGCIEHRTWSFLRDEGDFDADETADEITDIIYRGLMLAPSDHDLSDNVLSRLERVTARLQNLTKSEQSTAAGKTKSNSRSRRGASAERKA